MSYFQSYNPNPNGRSVGDCAIRAIAKATDSPWEQAYVALCLEGYILADLPNANAVWGRYLASHGFIKRSLPESCLDCYTVKDFAEQFPRGTYVLALSSHVVCVEDGVIYDSWDSQNEIILYYWEKG